MLQERGAATVEPALTAWTANLSSDEQRLEALWTYQALDRVEPKLLATLLHAGDYRIRAAAVRVLGTCADRVNNATELLAPRVADEHPQVRLEAVRALAMIPSARSAELALVALDRPLDRFLDYGLTLTLMDLQARWLPALQAGKFDFGGNVPRLLYALKAAGSPQVVPALVRLEREGKIAEGRRGGRAATDRQPRWAGRSGPRLARVVSGNLSPKGQVVALAAAAGTGRAEPEREGRAATSRNWRHSWPRQPNRFGSRRRTWPVPGNRPARGRVSPKSGRAGWRAVRPSGPRCSTRSRPSAMTNQEHEVLRAWPLDAAPRPRTRQYAIAALAVLDAPAAAREAVAILPNLNPEAIDEWIGVFVRRKQGADALSKAAASTRKKLTGGCRPDGHPRGAVNRPRRPRADRGLEQSRGPRWQVAQVHPGRRTTARLADLTTKGDAKRGEVDLSPQGDRRCLSCHSIGGAGGPRRAGAEQHRLERSAGLSARLAARPEQGHQGRLPLAGHASARPTARSSRRHRRSRPRTARSSSEPRRTRRLPSFPCKKVEEQTRWPPP